MIGAGFEGYELSLNKEETCLLKNCMRNGWPSTYHSVYKVSNRFRIRNGSRLSQTRSCCSRCRQVFYSQGLIIFGVRDSMQTLTTRMDSLVASQPSASTQGRLPAQPEVHPRGHCGAITTRSGKTTTDPLLPTPPLYVPPAFRPSQPILHRTSRYLSSPLLLLDSLVLLHHLL